MTTKIESFISHARSKGMDHQTIRMLLLSAGWKEKDISSALASGTLEMPIPVPPDAGSAKDAFFHLLTFTTLYSTVISLIILSFEYIGRWFPDASAYYQDMYSASASTIRWSIAVIVVSYPIFVWLARILHRECTAEPQKLVSGVRKWLTYLTLFVTACTLIGDFITLLFYLLDGELSIRFLSKVTAILLLAGLPFTYYFSALKMDPEQYGKSPIHRAFLRIASVIVLLFIGYGILLAGGPMQGRLERFDEERINDLRSIQNQIYDTVYGQARYETKKHVALPEPLPANLDAVAAAATYQKIRTTDPENGSPYVYRVKGTDFTLCATFGLSRNKDYDVFWNHPAGEACFTFSGLDPTSK